MNRDATLAYLKELRPFIIASLIFFAIGVAIGVALISGFPQLADHFSASIGGLLQMFRGLSKIQLATTIFLNNALKTLMAIMLGIVLGIVPALFLLANGVVLGVVFLISTQAHGLWLSTLAVLPHGMIELPAVFLGTSIGLMLGDRAVKRLRRKSAASMAGEFGRALKFFIMPIVPLLIAAALVEAFVTTMLVAPK